MAAKMVAAFEEPTASASIRSTCARASASPPSRRTARTPTTLLRRADAAMYAAKRGDSGFAVYDPHLHEQREEQLSLLSELRAAIDQGELRLVYQPKIELVGRDGGRRRGPAALGAPGRGMIEPDGFIPFAEQTGSIKMITAWVLDAAVRQAAAWRAQGRRLKVSVNISAQDLLDPELDAMVGAALARHALPPRLLNLEITESGVMQDAARAIDVLRRLGEAGVERSIDDFGTGYSSLAYLKQLPVDELKIDRSFVRTSSPTARTAPSSSPPSTSRTTSACNVIAEGVEDARASDLLTHLGCDKIQGYLVSRPLAPAAFETWLDARSAAEVSRIS